MLSRFVVSFRVLLIICGVIVYSVPADRFSNVMISSAVVAKVCSERLDGAPYTPVDGLMSNVST